MITCQIQPMAERVSQSVPGGVTAVPQALPGWLARLQAGPSASARVLRPKAFALPASDQVVIDAFFQRAQLLWTPT
jgi:hypothetical protein